MNKGLFITFEGNDGSGKTTISKLAYEKLKEMGYPVLYTREPGGIDIAEQIRSIILDPANTAMDERCEALLYAASRRQHLIEKVLPTVFLSVDFETGLSRVTSRGNKDRLDNESMEFHKLVAQGYELIKDKFKERMHIVDANPDVDTVLNNTVACLMEIIKNHV